MHGTLSIREKVDCECVTTYKAEFFFPSIVHYISMHLTGIKRQATPVLVIAGYRVSFQSACAVCAITTNRFSSTNVAARLCWDVTPLASYVYVRMYKCVTSQQKELYLIPSLQNSYFVFGTPSRRLASTNILHCPSRPNMELFNKVSHGSFLPYLFQFRIPSRSHLLAFQAIITYVGRSSSKVS